jgi:hypothetical protein
VWRRGSGLPRQRWLLISWPLWATAPRKIRSFTARELHLVVERRSEKLPIPTRAGLTPGSENDLRALRRVLPTIQGGVLCGDKAYCDGPLKERLAEDQNLDLLTPAREGKRPEDPSGGRQPVFRGRKPDPAAHRVPVQLDR